MAVDRSTTRRTFDEAIKNRALRNLGLLLLSPGLVSDTLGTDACLTVCAPGQREDCNATGTKIRGQSPYHSSGCRPAHYNGICSRKDIRSQPLPASQLVAPDLLSGRRRAQWSRGVQERRPQPAMSAAESPWLPRTRQTIRPADLRTATRPFDVERTSIRSRMSCSPQHRAVDLVEQIRFWKLVVMPSRFAKMGLAPTIVATAGNPRLRIQRSCLMT